MGNALPKQANYSVAEYMEIDRQSTEKIEYNNGDIFAMAGESLTHSLLSSNMNVALGIATRRKGGSCRT